MRSTRTRGRGPWLWMAVASLALASPAVAQDSLLDEIDWTFGPATAELGSLARVEVPEGYVFAGARDTVKLMEAMGNPETGLEKGFVAPDDLDWFLVFEFEDIGYVKDDEKEELDSHEILSALREGNDAGNREREKRGWGTLELVGWYTEPHYNDHTHNLEWATRLRSEGQEVVNHNTRVLGRRGVMSATLVADPELMSVALSDSKRIVRGFSYSEGNRYDQWVRGDKVAKYGLTALVTGGAVAVAAKSGLLRYLWKILVIAGVAIAGFVKKFFGRA